MLVGRAAIAEVVTEFDRSGHCVADAGKHIDTADPLYAIATALIAAIESEQGFVNIGHQEAYLKGRRRLPHREPVGRM
jgi:hypothetical protein